MPTKGPLDPIYDVAIVRGSIDVGVQAGSTPVTVTIDQAAGQADPTALPLIDFDVVFSEAVTGFTGVGLSLSGTGNPSIAYVTDSGDHINYVAHVTGMTGAGTVIADVAGGAATSIASGLPSSPSTSTDNTVTYTGGPTVTIEQGGSQTDPTELAPITFDVTFAVAVTGFTAADIDLSASTAPAGIGLAVATFTPAGDSIHWTFTVRGMSGPGDVIASIPAAAATAVVGGASTNQSTSQDNVVTYSCQNASPFDDDFNRPNTTNFTNGGSGDGFDNLGACWKQSGAGVNFWNIDSTEMRADRAGSGGGAGGKIAEPLHVLAGPDLTVEWDMLNFPSVFTSNVVYIRCDSGFTAGYKLSASLGGFGGPDMDLTIAGVGGGGTTSTTVSGGGSSMVPARWRLSAIGNSIKLETQPIGGGSWTTRLTLTDGTHTTGSHVGFERNGGGGGNTTQRIDNVTVV